jgi:hypothetical protein
VHPISGFYLVGEGIWIIVVEMKILGAWMRFVPVARAKEHSCCCKAVTAWWSATILDEQAVSTTSDGPRQSKKYDTRLAITLRAAPVAIY